MIWTGGATKHVCVQWQGKGRAHFGYGGGECIPTGSSPMNPSDTVRRGGGGSGAGPSAGCTTGDASCGTESRMSGPFSCV